MRRPVFVMLFVLVAGAVGGSCGSSEDAITGGADGGAVPPLGAGPFAVATLTIDVDHPDFETISYELACFGDTATVLPEDTEGVDAPAACTALADPVVEAFLVDGPPPDRACTQVYGGPDTARITGRVDDRPVDLVVDRADGCGIDAWDTVLGTVLPPPRSA